MSVRVCDVAPERNEIGGRNFSQYIAVIASNKARWGIIHDPDPRTKTNNRYALRMPLIRRMGLHMYSSRYRGKLGSSPGFCRNR